MNHLKVLTAIRSVTGERDSASFPTQSQALQLIRDQNENTTTWFVFDKCLSQDVLQSAAFGNYDFMADALSVTDKTTSRWIQRFCEVGLIMIDGEEHQRRRKKMSQDLARCSQRIARLQPEDIETIFLDSADTEVQTSYQLARRITDFLVTECIRAIANDDHISLDKADIHLIDFFSPLPTRRSLSFSNEELEKCATAIQLEHRSNDDQAAILSILIMGVRPFTALLTSGINNYISFRRSGQSHSAAIGEIESLDAYQIVPTNFVMRRCVTPNALAGKQIQAGDILYLFLASASGCPFSRETSIPFGTGTHYCSGARLTTEMMSIALSFIARMEPLMARLERTPLIRGKAQAFLTYQHEA